MQRGRTRSRVEISDPKEDLGERQKLELRFHDKLRAAEKAYRDAVEESGKIAEVGSAAARHKAVAREKAALATYSNLLKAFTDLVVHGKTPKEKS
jgi:hypothetical protein